MAQQTFSEIIHSSTPTVVDFYATWCAPCKMMTPVLEEVKSAIKDRAKIIKIDIDRNPQAAEAYGVKAVPTLIIFKNGKPVWRQSGVIPAEALKRAIEANY